MAEVSYEKYKDVSEMSIYKLLKKLQIAKKQRDIFDGNYKYLTAISSGCTRKKGVNMKELEKVLSEQIADMKVNDLADEETDNYPVYFDRTETDNSKWLEMLTESLKSAKTFEIHCWNEEKEWIDVALQYGVMKEDDWKYGKIVTGTVTQEFCDMLLGMPKPQDIDIDNKMTPFFNVFLNSGFQSSHYGTEVYIEGNKQ